LLTRNPEKEAIKMTAGSISVPTIVPLRGPVIGKFKNYIDTCTAIEIRTGIFVKTFTFFAFKLL
jgi:hypothetical protein